MNADNSVFAIYSEKTQVQDAVNELHVELAQLCAEEFSLRQWCVLECRHHHKSRSRAAQQLVHRARPLLDASVEQLQLANEIGDLFEHLGAEQAVGETEEGGGREIHRAKPEPRWSAGKE